MANILPRDKQVEIIAALCEGVSIRAAERLTGVHRDTVMRLGARVGAGCAALHDRMMRNLQVGRIEIDEAWSYIAKKQRRVKQDDPAEFGDCYVFIAMAATGKAIISYLTGKRSSPNTYAFIADLRERVLGAPEISSDGWHIYPPAIEQSFGVDVHYGMIEKHYAVDRQAVEAARRYSPAQVVSVTRTYVRGNPQKVSTSYIERQNLSLRMGQKRFSRLSNGFSKKLEHHAAAVSLYVAHYNLCRVHEALRVTPAMQIGVTDHVWTIGELVEAALAAGEPEPPRYEPFTVIEGGRP
jgi:IS1 family transposase